MGERPLATASTKAPAWTELNELSSSSLGGQVLFATDDWFAAAECLLQPGPPVWREGFTDQGKWMDGWETRRKRIPGHDWCIIQLGLPGMVHGVELDTSYFTGNFAPRASVQGARLPSARGLLSREGGQGKAASKEELEAAEALASEKWETLVEVTPLGEGYRDTCSTYTTSSHQGPFTHLRLNIFPDGGVARLRAYGVAVPKQPDSPHSLVDLVAAANGGVCIGYSDAHYGHPRNLIKSGRGVDMGDGWETARNPTRPQVLEADGQGILQVPGSEWAAFRLGLPGTVRAVEVDTNHFKGNFPDSMTLEACTARPLEADQAILGMDSRWRTLLPAVKLQAHRQHYFPKELFTGPGHTEVVTHIRVRMFPDGGISRLGILGNASLDCQ